MRNQKRSRHVGLLAVCFLALAGLLAACGSDDDTSNGEGATNGGGEASGAIEIGYIPWDEDIAVTYLWQHVLEEQGYDVTVTQLDVAPTFQGIADGSLDLYFDVWLPTTHEDYWEQYGDQVEDLGDWYDNAKLTIVVPDYVDARSIGDLAGMEDVFDGQIIGIESGAGLTRVTKESAMPTYGLDGFELVESSTTAMLASLRSATDAEEPIVVTLWRPHWAYAAFDIRDLEDPEGAMGEAEVIKSIARQGFSEDFPEVADAVKNWTMNDDQLGSLEDLIQNNPDDIPAAVAEWVEANREYVDSMIG